MTKVEEQTKNFVTLCEAIRNGDAALLEVQIKATGKEAAAIVAVNLDENGDVNFVPVALMIEGNGNPYEILNPPNPAGGFKQ